MLQLAFSIDREARGVTPNQYLHGLYIGDDEKGQPFLVWEIATVRSSTLVMIGFAVLFGLLAVFVAQSWLTNAGDARLKSLEAQQRHPAVATQTIVVAGKPLRYGNELNASLLHEIPWSQDSLPAGAI